MAYHDHEHCQICGAHFDSHADLEQHGKTHEPAQGAPTSQADGQEPSAPRPRKNREFTRSHRDN